MTEQERQLVIECLEYRRAGISSALHPQKHAMLCQLVERFKAAKVSDQKPDPIPSVTLTAGCITSVKEAIEQVERIVEMCEQVSVFDSSDAWDFASSVGEKAQSIGETIEERNTVTPAQQEALDNMESGISRWIR